MPYHFSKWRAQLEIAPDKKTVAGVIHDYVASLSPSIIRMLSERSQRILLQHPVDIQEAAVTLLHDELSDR